MYKSNNAFQQWLDQNGYYYIKDKNNKPSFKSKLTIKLKKHYLTQTKGKSKKFFSFK
uniref:Uncharacterized protein n=1 Tax=Florenciella sp. virus SA2 TaxID=3240092 RepID=A0AB39JFG7_9VIRU